MAPRPAMRREVLEEQHLQRVQDNVSRSLDVLSRQVLAEHSLVDALPVGTSETRVPHLLGRKPMGWLLVSPQADARVWESAPADSRFLYLTASAVLSTRLLVF